MCSEDLMALPTVLEGKDRFAGEGDYVPGDWKKKHMSMSYQPNGSKDISAGYLDSNHCNS